MLFGSLLLLGALATPPGAACVTGIPYEALEPEHGLIFEGTVTHIPGDVVLETIAMPTVPVEVKGLRVSFKVGRVWKGEPGSDVEIVYTHHAGTLHGRFKDADTFIVWAYRRGGRWMTSDCAPTVERALAGAPLLSFLQRLRR